MNLFLNKLFLNIPMVQQTTTSFYGGYRSNSLQGPSRDVFEKSASASDISFTSRRNGSTKKGDVLKDLDNITCPYSGVKMINARKMDRIERDLQNCKNMQERLDILEKHKASMQPLEKEMYKTFVSYSASNPSGSLNDCLRMLKPDCLAELRISQLKVIDNIDNISNNMDAKTALAVRKVTTNARKKIVDDKHDSIFKRKDLLADIHDVTKDYSDQKVVRQMWAEANRLPKSTNDINAFVVKYANRSPIEIASRLLRPSVASIEHIRPANPDSSSIKNGENELTNFMLAARDWNSGRGNTPLPDFVRQHPNIPKYSQLHMNDIIKAIHKGKLQDCDWYPYVLKEKLYNESAGLIDVSIDIYSIDKDTAFSNASDHVKNTYAELYESNKAMREATVA